MRHLTIQIIRRLVQGLFLLFFLFLFVQTESKGSDELGYPVRLFLDFDPLILFTTLLSAHAVAKTFLLSLILVVFTLVLGRVLCGWICPLGTLNNMIGSLIKPRIEQKPRNWHRIKYLLLIGLLASSLFTLQPVGILDPLSLLIRSFSISVYPLFNHAVRSSFDAAYSVNPAGIALVTEPVYTVLKKSVLSFNQPVYRQGVLIGILFLTVLGLNLVEKRFWCKYLCPLGALLGLLSRFSLLKRSVSEACTECGACAGVCQGGASPDVKGEWKDAECYYCWNCDDICPNNAVSFGFSGKKITPAMDLGRRRVVASALSGIAAVPLLRITPLGLANAKDPALLRPPGSLDEKEFLARCVKCGECMKVCITNGLQPTLTEAGMEGIWSPVLVPRIGYCEYRCTLCGQVCPTGAIKKLSLPEKAKVKIGLAMIDKGRCLPWAHATPCIMCEEVCPTPKKAVWLEETAVRDRSGRMVKVQQPRVDLELCIGCGICETKCPVLGRPAISVSSVGESRSKENQLLLSERNMHERNSTTG
ncbi:MAG: 4Fe-4S binding protein [Nitrospirota bacterium]|nr:4Fe-4S binding protein [Nitrospirota bacterium]